MTNQTTSDNLKSKNLSIDEDDELIFEDDEEILFSNDNDTEPIENSQQCQEFWKILIIDDEPAVHQATKLALRNLEFEGKLIKFLSAYSGQEARKLIVDNPDTALIFLDVVMETNDAGLKIVQYIREELNNKLVRIILRTGQPGDAPEESVIVDYDINDYKLKVELTRQKLLVTAISTLRAYRDLVIIDGSRKQISALYQTLEIARDHLEELVKIRTQELETEIEQRKKIEKTLRLTQFSLDRARDAVYFLNGNAEFFYVNQAACKTLGYSQEELLKMSLHEIDSNFSTENWYEHWKKIKQQESFTLESKHKTKEGKTLPVEITFNYLEFEETEYNCAIARDITERKFVEAQLKKANHELERLATIDSLTQIPNRRCFDQSLEREWKRMVREQKPLALILCDVDYFKNYNDFYGHQTGDNCLKQVAQIINQSIRRPGDLASRYGGEEFAVILPHTDGNGALHIAEIIRSSIEQLQLEHLHSKISPYITLSLGISSLVPDSRLSSRILVEQADQALYEAKNRGRNQCYLNQ